MLSPKNICLSLAPLLIAIGAVVLIVSTPVLAQNDSIVLCSDAEETGETIADIFLILSILGPIFGTLFFAGMAVADSAKTNADYSQDRRRVILLGFGVPVAIVFLETIAQEALIDQDIECFFP